MQSLLTRLKARPVLISRIFSKLDATRVAEALEHFRLATVQCREELISLPVGFRVQLNNAIGNIFCGDQNGVGGNEPDPAEDCIKFYERFRLV